MPYIGLGPEEGTVVDDDKALRYALNVAQMVQKMSERSL